MRGAVRHDCLLACWLACWCIQHKRRSLFVVSMTIYMMSAKIENKAKQKQIESVMSLQTGRAFCVPLLFQSYAVQSLL
jgi:hypothetical protein